MVFGELVDSVPILGSQRRSYILIGAAVTACGMLVLAGAAGGWLTFARADHLYVLGAMLLVIGTVVQNVVAEAMSTEVVPRRDPAGNARPEDDVRAELGMVQVISRLALSAGVLAVAGLSGWLASIFDRATVFLLGLVVPAISVIGVVLIGSETHERRPLDWRILGGGMAFGAAILALALGSVPFGQESIFTLSMAVICTMLVIVTREPDAKTRRAILFTSVIIFAAPDADRVLCDARPPRDLVRPHGVADEHGAGRRSAANQISQSDIRRRPRRLCRAWFALDRYYRDRADRSDSGHCAVRSACLTVRGAELIANSMMLVALSCPKTTTTLRWNDREQCPADRLSCLPGIDSAPRTGNAFEISPADAGGAHARSGRALQRPARLCRIPAARSRPARQSVTDRSPRALMLAEHRNRRSGLCFTHQFRYVEHLATFCNVR